MAADPSTCHSMATVCVLQAGSHFKCQALCGQIRLQQSVAKLLIYAVVQADDTIGYITFEHAATSRTMRQKGVEMPQSRSSLQS